MSERYTHTQPDSQCGTLRVVAFLFDLMYRSLDIWAVPDCAQRMRYLHTECLIGREPGPCESMNITSLQPLHATSGGGWFCAPEQFVATTLPSIISPSQLPRIAIRSATEPWRRIRQAPSWLSYKALHSFLPAKLRCARLFLSFPRHHVGASPFFGVRLSGLHTRRSRTRVSMLFCAQRRDRCGHRSILDAEHQAPRHVCLQRGP